MRSAFFLFSVAALTASVHADTFGSGENTFEIPFVTIGSPGNVTAPPVLDPLGWPVPGARVDYVYAIGKYEVSERIIAQANASSAAAGRPLELTTDIARGPDKPATGLSWFEAARFVNWLNADFGASPAYKFDTNGDFELWSSSDAGFDARNPFRNSNARYFLPTADEWHKAAYFDPEADAYWLYPYGTDTPPTPIASGNDPNTAVILQTEPADVQLAGAESLSGAVGMAGNIAEWEETNALLIDDATSGRRGVRGSWWAESALGNVASFRNSAAPNLSLPTVGIRIARIPEPAAVVIAFAGTAILLLPVARQPAERHTYS